MKRFYDWPTRLAEYFKTCENRSFEYGHFDCIIFACGAVEAMTGVNPAKDFIGKYKNKAEAARTIKKNWGAGINEILEKECPGLGLTQVPTSLAKRGDLVRLEDNGLEALGVVDLNAGYARVVGPNKSGVGQTLMRHATTCWSFN